MILDGWTRSDHRDRARYQELPGYRVNLFVLYLWLGIDGELVRSPSLLHFVATTHHSIVQ